MPKRRPSPSAAWKRASCASSMEAWKRARFTALASCAAAAAAARCLLASSCNLWASTRHPLMMASHMLWHAGQCWRHAKA